MDARLKPVKLLLVLALACPLGALAQRSVFEALCEDKMERAAPVVTAITNGFTIDRSLSFRQLGTMRGRLPDGAFVLGLTSVKASSEIFHESATLRNPITRYECLSPKVTVNLAYQPVTIYIGREFAPGTCAYQEILAHEMRHLNTYFDELPKVERVVRAAVEKRFNTRPSYAFEGQAKAALERELTNVWIPYLTRELTRVEAKQAAIDTPAEYARLSRVCAGEVQSMIRSTR